MIESIYLQEDFVSPLAEVKFDGNEVCISEKHDIVVELITKMVRKTEYRYGTKDNSTV